MPPSLPLALASALLCGCATDAPARAPAPAAAAPTDPAASPPSASPADPPIRSQAGLRLDTDARMAALVAAYAADEADLSRWLSAGPSPRRLDRLDALAQDWEVRLDAVDHEALGAAGRVDRLLLLSHIEHGRRQRAAERARAERLSDQLPFAAAITALEQGRWSLQPFEPDALAGELAELASQVEALANEQRDEPPELSAVDALWLADRVDGLASALGTWRQHHAPYDPGFGWWTDAPAERLDEALSDLEDVLRKERAEQQGEDDDPLVGDPIGRDALMDDLAHAWIADTPEQLLALGEAQLAWCHEAMTEAAAELGFGDDWRAALEHVKGLHVAPGEQDDLVLALGAEAVAFIRERELVSVPPLCAETWRVRMLSRQAQRSLPFAAYGGQHMLVAFPTDDMSQDEKRAAMRGNNVPFTRIVTPHELIPGHHLQGFMAKRHAVHRRLFSTPFLSEGWALHWEFMLWDLGWGRTPAERMGMLFWRAHRAARIVFSLRFHLGQLSAEQCVDFLVEQVGHERDNARAEVRRSVAGDYSPLYQCAYMLGALQLNALYDELVTEGAWSSRDFHDAVLRCGSIPIEMIRALLTDTELPADFRPSWRLTR